MTRAEDSRKLRTEPGEANNLMPTVSRQQFRRILGEVGEDDAGSGTAN